QAPHLLPDAVLSPPDRRERQQADAHEDQSPIREVPGVRSAAYVLSGVDNARVLWVDENRYRISGPQTVELRRVLGVGPRLDPASEDQSKLTPDVSSPSDSGSALVEASGCRNASLPQRLVSRRQLVPAVPELRHPEPDAERRPGDEQGRRVDGPAPQVRAGKCRHRLTHDYARPNPTLGRHSGTLAQARLTTRQRPAPD